jgi:uncharacterized SAM-binding protein YcdF (DUF218 family)
MSPLSRVDAVRIADFLEACAETDHADLCFVFGTKLPEPAYIAADFFRRGVVPLVALTGGINRVTGVNEAEQHLAILLEQGVPGERIILENRSTNTAENVSLAVQRIAERLELKRVRSLLAVTKWYHSRRALMTLKRYMPEGVQYFTKCYEPDGISRVDWFLNDESATVVLKEWQVIPKYLSEGGIKEVHQKNGSFE